MIYFVYDFFLFLGFLFYAPFYMKRLNKNRGYRPDLLARMGLNPPKPQPKRRGRILIHSVSVGETRAVIPLIGQLMERYPHFDIYLTTTTGTGMKAAEQIRSGEIKGIFYFPLDFGFVCAYFLRQIKPDIICLTETELWPNFIRIASRYSIPLCLINGRVSDRSFTNYRLFKPFIIPILKKFDSLCMQSYEDAKRILALGAPPDRVYVTGNIKFDQLDINSADKDIQELRDKLGLQEQMPVIVAGSTHPGEEEQVLDAYLRLLPSYSNLILILAPRHIERSKEVAQKIRSFNKRCTLWSKFIKGKGQVMGGDILLIDVIGLLARLYSIATIVFIGGSLIPHGGQNPLEPIFYGKPVLFGPHMENFRSISRVLIKEGAALSVKKGDLYHAMFDLLKDREKRDKMGRAGIAVIKSNTGAAKRTCDKIIEILGSFDAPHQ